MLLVGMSGCTSVRPFLEKEVFEAPGELAFHRSLDLLPPEGFRVTATSDRAISLAWEPVLVGDVAGYAVTRSRSAAGPYDLIGRTDSRFKTIYSDVGEGSERLGDGQTYSYRVHPYNGLGQVSRSHSYLNAITDPRPEVPEGLRAYSNLPRRVVLEWERSPNTSVVGYAVLRSPTVAGPWERVAYLDGRLETVHDDPVPGDLRVMYYRITALNRFNGESDMTDPIRAVTKAEPLPPISLALAQRKLGQAHLRWSANVEDDLSTYEVWRALPTATGWGAESKIAEVEAPRTQLIDATVGCGQRVRYRLRAIDADELVSDFSDPLEVQGEEIGLQAANEAGLMELRWDVARTRDWPGAQVVLERPLFPDRELGTVPSGHTFLLGELGPGQHEVKLVLSRDGAAFPDGVPITDERLTRLTCELSLRVP